jgi:hypothetical protein
MCIPCLHIRARCSADLNLDFTVLTVLGDRYNWNYGMPEIARFISVFPVFPSAHRFQTFVICSLLFCQGKRQSRVHLIHISNIKYTFSVLHRDLTCFLSDCSQRLLKWRRPSFGRFCSSTVTWSRETASVTCSGNGVFRVTCECYVLCYIVYNRGSIPGRGKGFFPLTSLPKPALGHTQPPVHWVLGSFSRG